MRFCPQSFKRLQPWRVVFASGPARDRLVAALLEEAHRGPPNIPPLPESFRHFRKELGADVYGAMGITREDKAGHDAAVLRNLEFFRAPLAGIVCIHRDLGSADALSVGMFLQTLLLGKNSPVEWRSVIICSRSNMVAPSLPLPFIYM
jgi:hypothetical protein